jgi:hypothetical protein
MIFGVESAASEQKLGSNESPNDEIRMSNQERNPNDEGILYDTSSFVIRHSDLFRHSSFVIRHFSRMLRPPHITPALPGRRRGARPGPPGPQSRDRASP